jgi:hypothetical protein
LLVCLVHKVMISSSFDLNLFSMRVANVVSVSFWN